jgi:hypothetical protein
MPLILPEEHHAKWLREPEDGDLKKLLKPFLLTTDDFVIPAQIGYAYSGRHIALAHAADSETLDRRGRHAQVRELSGTRCESNGKSPSFINACSVVLFGGTQLKLRKM